METLKHFILEQVAQKNLSAEEATKHLETLTGLSETQAETSKPKGTQYAVIGMAARSAQTDSVQTFWENLVNRKDSIAQFPKHRAENVKYVNTNSWNKFSKYQCRVGGYFDRIDLFDCKFFGLTPAEAKIMDPAQRIFLETAVEALEDANLTELELDGSKTGVFVGYSLDDDNYITLLDENNPNVPLGNQPSIMAYRLAYLMNLSGPTMTVDTTCSSSMVAIHNACNAIAAGDCDQAVAAGVNLHLYPAMKEIGNLGIEAFDGRCKVFDEKANGTNIAEGVGVLVIKKLEEAQKAGDFIHAVIKGSAINSDGNTNGLTAPNPARQADVLTAAWDKAGVSPEEISYIEAHGTGTQLGDPIEIQGLTYAFRKATQKTKFCALGAVKSNIGHAEAAAGVFGVIKAILCLKNRYLPPNIHFNSPNPYIDFENSAVYPIKEGNEWKIEAGKQRIAGISSFGLSGTNGHLVLEESPAIETKEREPDSTENVFLLSAKTGTSLRKLLEKYRGFLAENAEIRCDDLCYTAALHRNHHKLRLAFFVQDIQDLRQKIDQLLALDFDSLLNYQTLTPEGIFYADLDRKQYQQEAVSTQGDRTALHTLIHLYLQGHFIAWKQYYNPEQCKKITLPVYAFDQQSYWPALTIAKEQNREERLKGLFYQLEWKPQPLRPKATAEAYEGSLLICFMLNLTAHRQMVDALEQKGVQCVCVLPGDNYLQENNQNFTIRHNAPEDYEALLRAVESNYGKKANGFVHMWDCRAIDGPFDDYQSVSASQDYGIFSGLHLAQALIKHQYDSFKFATLSAYAHQVGEEHQCDPTRAAMFGLTRVVSQEIPKAQNIMIDYDIDAFDTFGNREMLFQELFVGDIAHNELVTYREGVRYVQYMDSFDYETAPERNITIEDGKVYVIAGGNGYLGLETATHLAKKAKVKVIALGRTPVVSANKADSELNDKERYQRKMLRQIEELGSEFHFLQADVSKEEDCQQVITNIQQQHGAVNGVFVVIKNISHKRLDAVTSEEFEQNILTKMRAVWLLDKFTNSPKLDFFVNFSSISSITGGPTGADCAASNMFLDSYVDYRNFGDRKKVINMNYTLIEADDDSLLSDRMSMIPPITKDEFLLCLDHCLERQISFPVIADFDSNIMNLVLPFIKIKFSDSLLAQFHDRKDGTTTPAIRQEQTAVEESTTPEVTGAEKKLDMFGEDLVLTVHKIWQEVLEDPEIGVDDNFFDIGGDSISALKLLHLLEVQLQLDMDVSDLYSYPTVRTLCEYLEQQHSDKPIEESNNVDQLLDAISQGEINIEEATKQLELGS